MSNVTVVIENGKVSGLNILNLDKFIKEDCTPNGHLNEYDYFWFNSKGELIGENIDDDTLIIEDEKFEDGTYFTYCQNPEESECKFSILIKKGGEVREIDEVEVITGNAPQEMLDSIIKLNEKGVKFYNTYFPMDLEFNRI